MARPKLDDDIAAIRKVLRILAKLDPKARLAAARFILAKVEAEVGAAEPIRRRLEVW